jgi:hypothetical protein
LKRYSASKDFLLEILASVTFGKHHFFDRAYKAPKRQNEPLIPPVVFDNSDGFFTGLPHTESKRPRVSHRMLTPAQRNDRERAKLAARIKRANEALGAYDAAFEKKEAKRKKREAELDSSSLSDNDLSHVGAIQPDLVGSDSDSGLEIINQT